MSAALSTSPAVAKRIASREPSALVTREVDNLVSRLLGEIKVPFNSLSTRVLNQLSDLKRILSTDYSDVPALPDKPLLKELARVVEKDIKQHIPTYGSLQDLGSPQLLAHLEKLFGPRELELRARAVCHRRRPLAAGILLPRRRRRKKQVRDFRQHRPSSRRGGRDARP